MKLFIMFGPPGAGKGTQSELLAKNLNLIHLSTGQLLRDEIKNKTEIGIKIEELLNKGHFAPDEMMIEIIKNFLEKHKEKNVILDGFPRTLPQAEELFKIEKNLEIIEIKVDEEELEKRLILRSKTQSRADDEINIIRERFRVYEKQTKPVLDFFKEKKLHYLEINGIGKVEDIQKDILNKTS